MDACARQDHLLHEIEHAAHLLPAQGPITVFVHHNTLHAFEESRFEQAVLEGAGKLGCEPYLSEEQYREAMHRGRIRDEDIRQTLIDDLGDDGEELLGFLGTRFALRMAMLQFPLRTAPSAELRWLVAETDALRHFRPEVAADLRQMVISGTRRWILRDLSNGSASPLATVRVAGELLNEFGHAEVEQWSDSMWESFTLQLLWRVCHQGVHGIKRFRLPPSPPIRHRDWLRRATGGDSDSLVHDVLLPFCAAFLDQGFAAWNLPQREQGFWQAFHAVHGTPEGWPPRWRRGLPAELARIRTAGMGPLESLRESLSLLGVDAREEQGFLEATLLALRGWAGMLWQVETRGDRVAHPAPRGTLVEYLAVRLILERLALQHVAEEQLAFRGLLSELRGTVRGLIPRDEGVSVEQRAFLAFQLAQIRGWTPESLLRLTKDEWTRLVQEIESFGDLERRRVLHLAYERRFRLQVLDALSIHTEKAWLPRQSAHAAQAEETPPVPEFQVICCIDDREESYRRYLEEIAPRCETFGAAGFFAVAMYYQGAADAHAVPLCPIIMQPRHHVAEEVPYSLRQQHHRRASIRRLVGQRAHEIHRGSRTFVGGVLTALFGPLASFPLVTRVLFPRLTARVRRIVGTIVQPPPMTQLTLERRGGEPGPSPSQRGFTIEEMAQTVERLLRDIGLTSAFARLVVVTGHGSSSLNNPHESAYNCGACGGGRGGPNARALARMANEPRVRDLLAHRGLVIPPDTWFLGAFHNTCDDQVTFLDLERLPSDHIADFERLEEVIREARERNAQERCRRFASADLKLGPTAALHHVEARAEDLSQTRPEYNHATNAACVVGRRSRTRGLFLDRRSFLVSYDPRQDDPEHAILTRILQAVVPVCAGINLEYYFSTVDVNGLGCGTKLPHNVTSLIGVMDGAASDLRTGLSAQMVEIHEAVRLLFVIETTPEALDRIMERNPVIQRLIGREWVQVATLDPHGSAIHVYRAGRWERHRPEQDQLPVVPMSRDWYHGWRDHLSFAQVEAALPPHQQVR